MKIGNFFLVFIVLGGYFLWKYQGYLKGLLATIPAPSGTVKNAIAKYATSILLVVVILVAVFLGISSSVWESLSFAAVSKWAWSYWALIAIAATACSALIALNKKELGAAAQVLQTALSLILVFVFIVCHVLGWFEGPTTAQKQSQSQIQQQSLCPNVSAKEIRSCVITSEWSNWIRLEDGARDNGKKMCHSLGVESERDDKSGATLTRFKAKSGKVEVKYQLYPIDTSCSLVGF